MDEPHWQYYGTEMLIRWCFTVNVYHIYIPMSSKVYQRLYVQKSWYSMVHVQNSWLKRGIILDCYTHACWEAERNIENEIFNKLSYSKDYISVWQLRFSQRRVNCQYFEMNFSYSTPNTHTLSRVIVSPGSGGTWELSHLETLTCFLCDHTNLCVPCPACETAVYAWTQTYVFQMVSVTVI